jgi:UDP-N-acetylglucosamine enolpyruvyl transferase
MSPDRRPLPADVQRRLQALMDGLTLDGSCPADDQVFETVVRHLQVLARLGPDGLAEAHQWHRNS